MGKAPVRSRCLPAALIHHRRGSGLSRDQRHVLDSVLDWWRDGHGQHITIGGYAGTGKTTLIGAIKNAIAAERPETATAFCCFTGKAARVLREKLSAARALERHDTCGTIHSLIYIPVLDARQRVASWNLVDTIPHELVFVDEASMVNEEIWRDLCSFGARVIAVGDHGQLPPVEGRFNLMEDPQLRLEKIHRQEEGNPIIRLSMMAREEGRIPVGVHGPGVEKMDRGLEETEERVDELLARHDRDTMVLCGLNRTRVALNRRMRAILGREGDEPVPGDRVICLRNNYKSEMCRLFNGMLGTVLELEKAVRGRKWHWYKATIEMDGEDRPYQGDICRYQFNNREVVHSVEGVAHDKLGDLFDMGYAVTVHKAQGSQARRVVLFEEYTPLWKGEMWNRWLYTAVTRAERELFIVGN
jgi:exodeoxyribonuclease-5